MTETELILAQYALNHANAWIMLIWAFAYYLFSGGLWMIERKLKTRVFGEHIAGVRGFVVWCAHSHICMWAIMREHVLPHGADYTFWLHSASLAVFIVGGVYSLYRAVRLWYHIPAIVKHFDDLIDVVSSEK